MKILDEFLVKLTLAACVVLVFHGFDFFGILKILESIYTNLARTIDPTYTLTYVAQTFLIWVAGISALWFVYK